MLSQNDLAQQWRNGATSGQASNVEIIEIPGQITLLVAFDTCVLGVRYSSGFTVSYAGWYQEGVSKQSGSPAIKNIFSRMNLWQCETIIATDMSDDPRAIPGDKRASRLADMYVDDSAATLQQLA